MSTLPFVSRREADQKRATSMLRWLKLSNFKNFEQAELQLGPFSVLIGTNASGKSNIRDALRFFHGLSRGYSLAEIIGEKWIEGGVLQWRGIRGGTREAAFNDSGTFTLEIGLHLGNSIETTYSITVDLGRGSRGPRVVMERLAPLGPENDYIFDSHPGGGTPPQPDEQHLAVRVRSGGRGRPRNATFLSSQPVLTQIVDSRSVTSGVRDHAESVIAALASMRFLDLSPDAMRIPSLPGQVILGDRGENLSSVLQAIVADPIGQESLVEWIRELTPMDAAGFEFPPDATGKILASLVEGDGRSVSAHSASDGTLRFLAMIAALLGPEPARLYFFEEIENGIHPARLHLLLQLIEQRVAHGSIQMITTSHSPELLSLLQPSSRLNASLVYRSEGQRGASISRIVDVPGAMEVFEKNDLGYLHGSGWFENVVELTADGAATG